MSSIRTSPASIKSDVPMSAEEAAGIKNQVTTISGNETKQPLSGSERDTGKWKEQANLGDVKEKEEAKKAQLEKERLQGYKASERFPLEPKYMRLGRDQTGRRK